MKKGASKKHFKVSVRSLVEQLSLRRGDLTLASGGGGPLDGVRAHQKVQRSRPGGYRSEVAISHRVERGEFVLEVGGRIDGVFLHSDRVVIEEIKTTHKELEALEENQLHWNQAKIYSHLWAREHDPDRIETQLTYYHLPSGRTRELRRVFSREELRDFFLQAVDRYLEWQRAMLAWKCIRDESMRGRGFPFADFRPGQGLMSDRIYQAIQQGDRLLVEAPTGIGKTMAVLFPALKALAEGHTQKLFYLAARTTGKGVAEKALVQLGRQGVRLRSVTLTAREKICFNPEKACNGEECAFARGYYDRLGEAVEELFGHDSIVRPIIERVARKHRVCPFELSLELALWSDLVICDYNHGLDPRSGLKRLGIEDRGGCTFLVDEAHNLVDRSRRMFSARLRKRPFLDLLRALGRDTTSPAGGVNELLARSARRINDWLAKTRRRLERGDLPAADREAPHDLTPLLREFAGEAEHRLALGPDGSLPNLEDLLDLYFEVTWFLKTAEQYDENYATCRETKKGDFSLRLLCLDPALRLEEALKRCSSAVFFSATLTPMHYFERVLGLARTAQRLVLPSPFPADNHCLLIYDGISTRYRDRTDTASAVARALIAFVSARPGNYLLFFPSYPYLSMVHQHFCSQSPPAEIILQTPAMAEEEREAFLERFAEQQGGTLVAFSVMGGVFGEGIDLVGEQLTGAVVVGVGLPGICPERELIADHFQQQEGRGFDYAYRYPGIQRVLQAAGRVIRSEKDRGVVLLIDDRFSHFGYRRLLPGQWNPVWVGSERAVGMALNRFWRSSGF